tara:strand:+ start:3045 stop:3665 length:621 start_codon:yes stop_codon:yes gene_type:complete
MSAISRLFRPLDYLRIKHAAKRKYDLFIPFWLSVILTGSLIVLPKSPVIFGEGGLLEITGSLLGILTGFFIASLAAVSTFNKQGMDDEMPGEPLILLVFERGEEVPKKISRRQFLCLLFGYLSFICVFLYLMGGAAMLTVDSMVLLIKPALHSVAKWGFVFVYLLIFSNLLITTLLGLFYLSDRIHRHDPKLKGGVGAANQSANKE